MNDLKFSKYSPKISNCLYNNIKHRKRDELTYIHCKYFNLHRSTFIYYVDVHFTYSCDLPNMSVLIVV